MKKLAMLAMAIIMILPSSVFASQQSSEDLQNINTTIENLNDDENLISPASINVDYTYWVDSYGSSKIKTEGSKKTLGTYTAKAAGETYTASASIGYSHTYSGTIIGNLKNVIQVSLGYSFGTTATFTGGPTSRSLAKGETVTATYYTTYEVTPVKQTECKHTYGYKYVNGFSVPVNDYDYTYKTIDAKEAIAPTITLSYSKAKSARSLDSIIEVTSVETYEFIDGEYVLVDLINY